MSINVIIGLGNGLVPHRHPAIPWTNVDQDAWWHRVLHTLAGAADNGLTRDFRLARPHWNNMARLSWHAKHPNPLQMYGYVICFEINCTWKQMSHNYVSLSMLVRNLVNWWKPARNSCFICGMQHKKSFNCTCLHVNVWHKICQDSQHQFHRWFTNIPHHEIFVILLEVAVNLFRRTWFQIWKFTCARPWPGCVEIAALSLIRWQHQLACEGLYMAL